MKRLPSHHSLLLVGHHRPALDLVGALFGLRVEQIAA
jgi:nanoRNase/pAp phosphatase (c-di-AMP/oligoRNAs hydrolase)